MRKILFLLFSMALASVGYASPVNALIFTFDASNNGTSTITRTVDGVTLTAENPVDNNIFTDVFQVNNQGIRIGNSSLLLGILNASNSSFSFSFDTAVILNGYSITIDSASGDETFDITTVSASNSLNNFAGFGGSQTFTNQFILPVGTSAMLTIDNASFDSTILGLIGGESVFINDIDVTPIPFKTDPKLGVIVLMGALGLNACLKAKENATHDDIPNV